MRKGEMSDACCLGVLSQLSSESSPHWTGGQGLKIQGETVPGISNFK